MEILISIIISLAMGVLVGYKGGIWLTNTKMKEENDFLKDQLEKVKDLSNYWASQATGRSQAQQSAIHNHNINLNSTLGTVIHLLQSVQQANNNLSQEDRRKVEHIIQQAKGITSYQSEG